MFEKIIIYIWNKFEKIAQDATYNKFREKYNLHTSFVFNGKNIIMYDDGEINIDENSYIGSYSTLQATKGYKINIGKNCKISHNVRLYTQTSEADFDFSLPNIPSKYGDIIIEDYVWIGANVFINPNITIGKNSIIGANSVVTKNIEPYSIYGGVPAKLIKFKNHGN